jgi:hypothetical protein
MPKSIRAKVHQDRAEAGGAPVEHHVGGLDITVHQAFVMCIVQRAGETLQDGEGLVERQTSTLTQQTVEIWAVNELHNHVVGIILGDAKVVHLHDVGVLELCGGLCFPFEAFAKVSFLCQFRR